MEDPTKLGCHDAQRRFRQLCERATDPQSRLEYLRGELRAERISWGELFELQSLVDYIEPHDVELLEAAGVPEFSEEGD